MVLYPHFVELVVLEEVMEQQVEKEEMDILDVVVEVLVGLIQHTVVVEMVVTD